MPIYEYKCDSCGSKFEKRRNIDDRDADIKCTECGAEKAQRLFSAFSSGSGGSVSEVDSGPPPSG